jgi:hypothetical protein
LILPWFTFLKLCCLVNNLQLMINHVNVITAHELKIGDKPCARNTGVVQLQDTTQDIYSYFHRRHGRIESAIFPSQLWSLHLHFLSLVFIYFYKNVTPLPPLCCWVMGGGIETSTRRAVKFRFGNVHMPVGYNKQEFFTNVGIIVLCVKFTLETFFSIYSFFNCLRFMRFIFQFELSISFRVWYFCFCLISNLFDKD